MKVWIGVPAGAVRGRGQLCREVPRGSQLSRTRSVCRVPVFPVQSAAVRGWSVLWRRRRAQRVVYPRTILIYTIERHRVTMPPSRTSTGPRATMLQQCSATTTHRRCCAAAVPTDPERAHTHGCCSSRSCFRCVRGCVAAAAPPAAAAPASTSAARPCLLRASPAPAASPPGNQEKRAPSVCCGRRRAAGCAAAGQLPTTVEPTERQSTPASRPRPPALRLACAAPPAALRRAALSSRSLQELREAVVELRHVAVVVVHPLAEDRDVLGGHEVRHGLVAELGVHRLADGVDLRGVGDCESAGAGAASGAPP